MCKPKKHILVLLVAFSLLFSTISETPIVLATEQEKSLIFEDTFDNEEDGLFKAYDGEIKTFDPNEEWSDQGDFEIPGANTNIPLNNGAKIVCDIVLPQDASFNGVMKIQGVFKIGDNWAWTQGNNIPELTIDDFVERGDGYLYARIEILFGSEVESGIVQSTNLKFAGYKCNYEGIIYIDNFKIYNDISYEESNDSPSELENILWTFDNDTENWIASSDHYDYKGTVEISHSNINGGSLAVDLDYSDNINSGWSEAKIQYTPDSNISYYGYNQFDFDFIYNENAMSCGSFQIKVYIDGILDKYTTINSFDIEDMGNNLKKVKVTIPISPGKSSTNSSIIIGIVGSNTDYKGKIYIDNICFSQISTNDFYVDIVREIEAPTQIDILNLELPNAVSLVDENANNVTKQLYSYLLAVGKTDKVLFGHQNDTHHQVYTDGSGSDTKDITDSIAAIIGIDTLSFTGDELTPTPGKTCVETAADISIKAAQQGAIITLSCHMPNFATVTINDDGSYNYSGYSPNVTSGNVVKRIMPSGDLNEIYIGYLDMIAEYAKLLEAEGIPVLFRPFHENNGSWFWWGAAYCDPESYKNLFRYTVEYLRDEKDVHNFLYVYSPNGPFVSTESYLSRYPGDEFVDIIAFDMYHDNPTPNDKWMDSFRDTINLVQRIADKKGKVSAVSECGMRVSREDGSQNGLLVSGNKRLDWYNEITEVISDSNMPYFLAWANFNETNFYIPYKVSNNRGHEMINHFIDFYNNDKSVFADGTNVYKITNNIQAVETNGYGYIIKPFPRESITQPTSLLASIKIKSDIKDTANIKFVLINNEENKTVILPASTSTDNNQGISYYTANITNKDLKNIGKTMTGEIKLMADNIELNKINYIAFNMEKGKLPDNVIEDFETYFGDNDLLSNAYSANCDSGCSAKFELTENKKSSGSYGGAFHYNISNEKSSIGYSGLVKSIEADWTNMDSIQFWMEPDGKGQHLIIQLKVNGEEYEVNLQQFAKTTDAKVVTIPFTKFKSKTSNNYLSPELMGNVQHFAIYCNLNISEGRDSYSVKSIIYVDDIKVVKSGKAEITYEELIYSPEKPYNNNNTIDSNNRNKDNNTDKSKDKLFDYNKNKYFDMNNKNNINANKKSIKTFNKDNNPRTEDRNIDKYILLALLTISTIICLLINKKKSNRQYS